MPRPLLAALAALLLAAPATADPVATAAAGILDGVRAETLANGLRVYLKPVPGSPVVTTKVAYRVGAADEELSHTGLSHYLEHLMFKGTDKRMPGDIDRLTQKFGGRNNAYTSEDCTVYHFDFAAEHWLTGLDVEADRMRGLVIDERHEFEQEKGAVIAELDGGEDEPWDREQKAVLPLLFGESAPYGHSVIGTAAHVRAATAGVIKRHYDRWYHPNNAVLVVVGGFDPEAAMREIRGRFEKIPAGQLPPRHPVPPVPARPEAVRREIPSKFDLARLIVGYNGVVVGDADDYALDVASHVLTGGKTGRLYRALVEGSRLATSVDTGNMAGRYPGWFAAQVELVQGGGADARAAAERVLLAELAKLASEPVTPAELARAKRALLAATIFGSEDTHGLADRMARAAVTDPDGRIDYARTYPERIAAVTADDVRRAAQRLFADGRPVLVWSVPREKPAAAVPAAPVPAAPAQKNATVIIDEQRRQRDAAPAGAAGPDLSRAKLLTLASGVRVALLEDRRLPIVLASVTVPNAGYLDAPGKLGVSTLAGMLLDEGTIERSGEAVAAAIEDTGGSLSLSLDSSTVRVLTPDTDLGLKLLFECLLRPAFRADDIERVRPRLLSAIADAERDPQRRAEAALRARVYGDLAPGRPELGVADHVAKLTRDDLIAFHREAVVPARMVCVVVGDFDAGEMAKKLEALVPAGNGVRPAEAIKPVPAPEGTDAGKTVILSDPEASQLHVSLGHAGVFRNDPDYYRLLVLDNVLGTGPGFTDRLSSTLRDRLGLAYTVTAQSAAGASDLYPGMFAGYIGTFPDKLDVVKAGFLKEIARIRAEPPAAEEVEAAKQYLIGSLAFRTTTGAGVAGQLAAIVRYDLGLDYLERFQREVAAVTPADVHAAAQKHLKPELLRIVACGPVGEDGKPLASGGGR